MGEMKMADYELALNAVRARTDFKPRIGIVLGSGLGGLADDIDVVERIPYSELEGFPRSTVEGHKGEYIFGYIENVPVVLMNGRVHFYEGYPMQKVVLPVRVMALMGVEAIILTNAAGGLNINFHPGTLMCITDQNTAFVPSPLIGPNDSKLTKQRTIWASSSQTECICRSQDLLTRRPTKLRCTQCSARMRSV